MPWNETNLWQQGNRGSNGGGRYRRGLQFYKRPVIEVFNSKAEIVADMDELDSSEYEWREWDQQFNIYVRFKSPV